jgi:membrane-bound metal-dependent hydrolase YbcI (DUF457 family)
MLPPGHIAAGYLTAHALLKITQPDLDQHQINQLFIWGTFFGFAPDLDTFAAFAKEKAFVFKDKKGANHRKFWSHAPALWLIAGLLIYFTSVDSYWKYVGLLLWLGSWSHFLLDTIQYGIMWLWPFSKNIFAIKDKEMSLNIQESRFFPYWWKFVREYSRLISFKLEVLIILIAIIVILK